MLSTGVIKILSAQDSVGAGARVPWCFGALVLHLLSHRLFLAPHLEMDIHRKIEDHLRLSSGQPIDRTARGARPCTGPREVAQALRPTGAMARSRGCPPQTRNPKSETRTPKPETRNLKPKTQNPKPQIPKSKPQTPNAKPESRCSSTQGQIWTFETLWVRPLRMLRDAARMPRSYTPSPSPSPSPSFFLGLSLSLSTCIYIYVSIARSLSLTLVWRSPGRDR